MTVDREFDELASELESQGWHREAELLRRFPRTAWDDEFVKGMFIAAVSVRDTGRAERIARQLVRLAPENPFAYLALCLVKLRQDQTVEAAKAFDRALHFASTFPTYRAQKIHWLCLQGKWGEARQILRDTMKGYADRWEIQRAKAHVLLGSGKVDSLKQAIKELERLARLHPNDPITHALLAQALRIACKRQSLTVDDEGREEIRERIAKHLQLMAKNLPELTFNDTAAFIPWKVATQTLAEYFGWLKPVWFLERFLIRWLPPRYFIVEGVLWFSVALFLAAAKFFLPKGFFNLLVCGAGLAFVHHHFSVPLLVWLHTREAKRAK